MVGLKRSPQNCEKNEIIQVHSPTAKDITLEINNRNKSDKSLNMWKLNSTFLNNLKKEKLEGKLGNILT